MQTSLCGLARLDFLLSPVMINLLYRVQLMMSNQSRRNHHRELYRRDGVDGVLLSDRMF